MRNILKSINFHLYKVHLVQELNKDDPDRRVEFCEIMMDRIDRDPLFLYNTVFSDEATFTLKGEVNRQNLDIGPTQILIGCWKVTYNIHKRLMFGPVS